jgi:Family of unknown function (DUF6281)
MMLHASTHLRTVAAAGIVGVAIIASSCGTASVGHGVGGGASCAFVVHYGGRVYTSVSVEVAPLAGRQIGVGTIPRCDDGGGGSSESIGVARLPGASSGVALVVVGREDLLLVAEGAQLPAQARVLLHAPPCLSGGGPVMISGPWLGILGADGHSEVDLKPPYDVDLRVRATSDRRYQRAQITVRVPFALGRPLTHHDVRSSLWKGGTISVTATCQDGRFIADTVETSPPT